MSVRAWLAAGLLALLPLLAAAQGLPPGVRLGIGVDELRRALPTLEAVRRPQRLAGGLAGSWQLDDARVAGLAGAQTFFFAAGALRRVEFVAGAQASPDEGAAAFDAVVAWGRGLYGAERPAQDAFSRYAAWSAPEADVYVRLSMPPRAGLQLVFSARPARDDGTL